VEYRWSCAGSPVFDGQEAAEDWLSQHWRALVDAGVDEVTLRCDGEVVYGPMSLHPAE
jgi:hypothetical protein